MKKLFLTAALVAAFALGANSQEVQAQSAKQTAVPTQQLVKTPSTDKAAKVAQQKQQTSERIALVREKRSILVNQETSKRTAKKVANAVPISAEMKAKKQAKLKTNATK